VLEHIPGGRKSGILINDYASPEELVAYLRKVAADEALYNSYRAWATTPRPAEWLALMAAIEPSSVRCRVCEFLAARAASASRDEL
jgi:hypothetical protein